MGDGDVTGQVDGHVVRGAGDGAGAPVARRAPVAAGGIDPADRGWHSTVFERLDPELPAARRPANGATAAPLPPGDYPLWHVLQPAEKHERNSFSVRAPTGAPRPNRV